MKIFISCDMEGVAGVCDWRHAGHSGGTEYQRARRAMTAELNAAVRGAVAAGASSIVVNDSHGGGTNILIEELHPAARLVTGFPLEWSVAEGLTTDTDAALLLGYHSRAGTPGVLNHTYTGAITHFSINGRTCGELGLIAFMAGSMGVPVALVSGDDRTRDEARSLLGPIMTVTTKQALGRYAAASLTPAAVVAELETRVQAALAAGYLLSLQPLQLQAPVVFEVGFATTQQAGLAAGVAGARPVSPRAVAITAPTYPEAMRGALALIEASGA